MFISPAFAQSAGAAAPAVSLTSTLLQALAIFAVFYFLFIRPQIKRAKQHNAMISAIKRGDKIVTGGGILATVADAADPEFLTVEIADGVKIKVDRASVRGVLQPEAAAVNDNKTSSKTKSKTKK